MNFLEHFNNIDEIVEKEKYEKKKKEVFSTSGETADELYVKSCGADE